MNTKAPYTATPIPAPHIGAHSATILHCTPRASTRPPADLQTSTGHRDPPRYTPEPCSPALHITTPCTNSKMAPRWPSDGPEKYDPK